MREILDNELESANVIVLVIEGSIPRFSTGLYDMLKQMSSIYGENWWNFMMVGVSKWRYDQESIDERQEICDYYGDPSDYCKNEAWFIRELSQQFQEKFGIERNLTYAFMDSWSQAGPNLHDEVQQSHWNEETNKLWSEATYRSGIVDFKTIGDILEENALCKEEINRLHDIITEDIKQLKENITSLDTAIHYNSDTIADMEDTITTNRERITENRSFMIALSEDVTDLEDDVGNLSILGRWCGSHNDNWREDNAVITYDKMLFSNTNMNISEPPLDINTGIKLHPVFPFR